MSEWRECKLGDFIEVKHGFAFKGSFITEMPNDKILVTPGNFNIGGGFKKTKFKYFNSNDFPDEYILNEGDVVVTMTDLSKDSDTLGYSAKIPKPEGVKYLHNQRVGLVQFKSLIVDKDFLYWLMRTRDYQGFIVSSASGTSIMHTAPSRIKDYCFSLPPLPEQTAIASILSSLDDKIDLLHRQNATLEKMAETLFRQWFVEEAKEEWEEGKFADEFDIIMGASPPGESYNEKGNGIPMYQGNADFGFRFPRKRVFTTDPRRFAEQFDILVSVRAPVGEQNMANERCCIGRGVAAFRFKKDKSYFTYSFYKIRSLINEIKQFNETGTVFGSISKSDFEGIEVTFPDMKSINKFQLEVKPIDDKILNNINQIRNLSTLLDTLLPKLMSGEVRVKL